MTRITRRVYAAIDLGAGSGRVIAGVLEDGRLSTREVHRFATPHSDDGRYLRWDIAKAFDETLRGLSAVQRLASDLGARFAGIGVDSWGVDYGLLSRGRVNLGDVRHHRGAGVVVDGYDRFRTSSQERYESTGILDQSINTIQQLAVRASEGSVPDEAVVLFIPDLWVHLLSGAVGTDPTIASTSQLLDVHTGNWSPTLLEELAPAAVNMPPVSMSGSFAGSSAPVIMQRIGAPTPVPVFRVAGHDTASAFGFARPAARGARTSGIVSSGTWSLAGLCLERPVTGEAARDAGFTTERGMRGFLMVRNLSGMWLLQECLRAWNANTATPAVLSDVLAAAEAASGHREVVDLADGRLVAPGGMPERLSRMAVESGRPEPTSRGEIVRVILDGLAAAYTDGIDRAAELADVTVHDIRIVGGGSRNQVLCQLVADRSGRTVVAGPAEATAIGNLAAQIWASGLTESIEDAYDMVSADAWGTTTYHPQTTGALR